MGTFFIEVEMKNYFIGFLAVLSLLLASVVYNESRDQQLAAFPVETSVTAGTAEYQQPSLILYLFFSKKNCMSCMQIIPILNSLKYPFEVVGIVPEDELASVDELRAVTRATFPLIPFSREYAKLRPVMWPSLYGVSKKGWVLFIWPSFFEFTQNFENLLKKFYIHAVKIL